MHAYIYQYRYRINNNYNHSNNDGDSDDCHMGLHAIGPPKALTLFNLSYSYYSFKFSPDVGRYSVGLLFVQLI